MIPAATILTETTMKTVEFVRQHDIGGHGRQVHFQSCRGVGVNHLGQEDTVWDVTLPTLRTNLFLYVEVEAIFVKQCSFDFKYRVLQVRLVNMPNPLVRSSLCPYLLVRTYDKIYRRLLILR
jgi:hypothetical protein